MTKYFMYKAINNLLDIPSFTSDMMLCERHCNKVLSQTCFFRLTFQQEVKQLAVVQVMKFKSYASTGKRIFTTNFQFN